MACGSSARGLMPTWPASSLWGASATQSHRPDSGAGEPAGVVGSRVAAGHHGVTRSALDAARRRAESGAPGRRRNGEVHRYLGRCGNDTAPSWSSAAAGTGCHRQSGPGWRPLPAGDLPAVHRVGAFRSVPAGGALRSRAVDVSCRRVSLGRGGPAVGGCRRVARLETLAPPVRGPSWVACTSSWLGATRGMGAGSGVAGCARGLGVLAG
jgi:hypothetical protein